MRIGLVTGEYPPMEGGVGAFSHELGRAMAALGHEVFVFTRAAVSATKEEIDVTSAVRGIWGWQANKLACEWVVSRQIDVVNIQMQTAAYNMHPAIYWLPSLLTHTAITVVTFHDLRVPYLFPKAGRFREWVVKKIAEDSCGVITTDPVDSMATIHWQIRHRASIPIGSNILVASNNETPAAKVRSELGMNDGQLLLCYFGFLNESKGALVLIKALSIIVTSGLPVHLLMIGSRIGSSDQTNVNYAKLVDETIQSQHLEQHITWTGFVDDRRVSECLSASDLCILPYLDGASLRRGTFMAAMAHGCAIVTTYPKSPYSDLAGTAEFVPAGDPHSLAASIMQLWHNQDRRQQLRTAAGHRAAEFTWDKIAAQTIRFYEEILNAG